MPQVSATHFSRHLKDYLDRVERGESFTIVRHGRTVAQLEPRREPNGRALLELYRSREPDPGLADDIEDALRYVDDRDRDPWAE